MAMGTVGVAPGTTTFTLANGDVIALADWIDDRYYGVAQLATGSTAPVEVFSAGRSQQIPGGTRTMTRVDTNIPRPGSNGLPQAYEMLVFSIEIELTRAMRPATGAAQPQLPDTGGALSAPPFLQTLFQVDRVVFCEFSYQDKYYSQGVMKDFPAGRGYSVFATSSDFEIAQNGIPSPRDRNALVLPIHLKEGLGYKLLLQPEAAPVISQAAADGGTALTFVDLKVTMVGLIKRPVV